MSHRVSVDEKVGIFRLEAVRAHNERGVTANVPAPLRIEAPSGWLLFVPLCMIVILALGVSLTLELSWSPSARGVLRGQMGALLVKSPWAGVILDLGASEGASVRQGDILARVAGPGLGSLGVEATVSAPRDGYVERIFARPDHPVEIGAPLFRLLRSPEPEMMEALFAARELGPRSVGLEVDIQVDGVSAQASGVLRGKIVAVAPSYAGERQAFEILGFDRRPSEPQRVVTIALVRDATFARLAPELRIGMGAVAREKPRKLRLWRVLLVPRAVPLGAR
jgi:biotin carboxyl carrier protein